MKNKLHAFYQQVNLPEWIVPIILLGVSFAAFGIFAPKMGFYMDDWHFVYYAYTRGVESLSNVLFYDSRPFGGWIYQLGFNMLGFKPVIWHITSLVLRAMTAIFFWLLFRSIWDHQKKYSFYISILFLVYPFFLLQPMSVAYSIHWVGFLFYALSLWLMIMTLKNTTKFSLIFISIALMAEGLHLFTSEYFSGLEILRPFILWVLISRQEKNVVRRIGIVFSRWLPYLLVFSIYGYWRVFIFQGPPGGDRNDPVLLFQFISEPIGTAFQLLNTSLKDSATILFNSWYQTLTPDIFELNSFFSRFALVAVLISFFGLNVLMNKLEFHIETENNPIETKRYRKESFLLGIVALFSGTLPIWIIGKAISTHKNQMAATRFGLPSMLGAAILLVFLIDYLILERKRANAVISLGVALAIGFHLNNAHLYKYSWEKQKNLYQQIALRVPELEPNTAIISEGEILPIMGEYPTSYAINSIYYPFEGKETPYWFFAIYPSFYMQTESFFNGMLIEEQHLLSDFTGDSKESLLISFEPERGQCLWVLRPEDSDLRLISKLMREASLNSAIGRIQSEDADIRTLPIEIYGDELQKNWCFYYQQADLARQNEAWIEIINLWEEAEVRDRRPENGFEIIPFIEGYAHQGDWNQVRILTRRANKVSQGMESILCSTLFQIADTTPASINRKEVMESLSSYLNCQE